MTLTEAIWESRRSEIDRLIAEGWRVDVPAGALCHHDGYSLLLTREVAKDEGEKG